MMRRPVLAANWKMHHAPPAARDFVRRFLPLLGDGGVGDRSVLLFPPAISLTAVHEVLGHRDDVLLGVQNIHWEPRGAFTGELSAEMAAAAGARFALVGHSERRHLFGETEDETARKCAAAVRAGLAPVLCVGETLTEHESGHTESVVVRQLRAGLGELSPDRVAGSLIAYEPVWAIGTGRTASPADASAVQGRIRRELRALIGERADTLPILYGGSVKPDNASELLAAPDVDGLLVGGASLEPESWAAIVRARAALTG